MFHPRLQRHWIPPRWRYSSRGDGIQKDTRSMAPTIILATSMTMRTIMQSKPITGLQSNTEAEVRRQPIGFERKIPFSKPASYQVWPHDRDQAHFRITEDISVEQHCFMRDSTTLR